MIVIIDKLLDKSYHTKFKTKASKITGMSRDTMRKWENIGKYKGTYKNRFKIYLNSENI